MLQREQQNLLTSTYEIKWICDIKSNLIKNYYSKEIKWNTHKQIQFPGEKR